MTAAARPAGLDRAALVDAALGLIRTDGQEALSMRRLAERFGVQPASLYYHVPSKDALLDLAADRLLNMAVDYIAARPYTATLPDEPLTEPSSTLSQPRARLQLIINAYRDFLYCNPGAAQVLATRLPAGPGYVALLNMLAERFAEAGASRPAEAAYLLLSWATGMVMQAGVRLSVPDGTGVEVTAHRAATALVEAGLAAAEGAWMFLPNEHAKLFYTGLDALVAGLTGPNAAGGGSGA